MTRERVPLYWTTFAPGLAKTRSELAEIAREIEARRKGIYVLNDEDEAALARSHEDSRHERFATDDEVKAVFDRYRHQGEARVVRTLALAMSKAAILPEAAQEQIGRELPEWIDGHAQLRAEIEIGLKELDAGLGQELDIEEFIRELKEENDREQPVEPSASLSADPAMTGRSVRK